MSINIKKCSKNITKKTKIIAFADISNVLGYVVPTKEITEFAHSKNIVIVCDAAQSIAPRIIDAQALDVDFLVFSAHKMYGPTGVGVFCGK